MTLTIVIAIAIAALLAGVAAGWLIASSRAAAANQRLLAERDSAIVERSRTEQASAAERQKVEQQLAETRQKLEDQIAAAREKFDEQLAATREKLQSEQGRRIEADTRTEELRRHIAQIEEMVKQEMVKVAIDQLPQVLAPYLDGTRNTMVSALEVKKTEIEGLLTPLQTMVRQYEERVQTTGTAQTEGLAAIKQQITALLTATQAAEASAAKLASALQVPNVRGSWGENTLRRCVELAGMSEFVHDFTVQTTVETKEGDRQRPDMVVNLPTGRVIAIDSKAPIAAYLEAVEQPDESRKKLLLDAHAKNLKKHVDALAKRDYQASVGETLDFTIMFLSGEQFLSAALITDPSIFEYAVERKIFLATPTILLPLLRAVEAGWKAEKTEESAREALSISRDLYERFVKVFEYIEGVGKSLNNTVSEYNQAVRSIDSRLVPKAKELQSHVSSSKAMPEAKQIEDRPIQSSKISIQAPLIDVVEPEPVAAVAGVEGEA